MSNGILKRTVRGIRDSIPGGYIIGRSSNGDGPAELISFKSLGQAVVATGTVSPPVTVPPVPADFGFFFSGKPTGDQILFEFQLTKSIVLPASLTGGKFGSNSNPTADYTATLKKNGSSIGTVKFNGGGATTTITFATAITFAIGDTFQVSGQTVTDTTFGDFWFAFVATFA